MQFLTCNYDTTVFLSLSLSPPSSLPLSLSLRLKLMKDMALMQRKFYDQHKGELDLIESEPKMGQQAK